MSVPVCNLLSQVYCRTKVPAVCKGSLRITVGLSTSNTLNSMPAKDTESHPFAHTNICKVFKSRGLSPYHYILFANRVALLGAYRDLSCC